MSSRWCYYKAVIVQNYFKYLSVVNARYLKKPHNIVTSLFFLFLNKSFLILEKYGGKNKI